MLTDRIKASYLRALASQFGPGEIVTLRRASGTGAGDYSVYAWVIGLDATDLVGGVSQLRRRMIVLADSVTSVNFPTPFLVKKDRVIWNGKTLAIMAVDDGSRRIQDKLIAYELEVTGA